MRLRLLWLVPLVAACAGSFQPDFDVPTTGTPGGANVGIEVLNLFVFVPEAAPGIPLLLDTGAPFSSIDARLFPGATQRGSRLDHVTVAGVTFEGFWNANQSGLPILGAEVFGELPTRFDYRAGTITFAPAEAPADVLPLVEHAFELEGGGLLDETRYYPATRIFLEAEIEGSAVTLLLDTGADSLYVRRSLFDSLVADGRKTATANVAIVGGSAAAPVARTPLVRALGQTVTDAFISVLEQERIDLLEAEAHRPVDGVLGTSFLRHFTVDVDYPARVLRLYPYRDQGPLFDPYTTIGLSLRRSSGPHRYEVAEVMPSSDALRNGFMVGDALVRIDGVDLDSADPLTATKALSGVPGTTKQVTTDRGVFDVLVEQLL